MSPTERPSTALSAEESINAILEAEQRSRAELERLRGEAQRLVADARERARRIHERANARSVAMRQRAQRSATARADELRRAAQAARTRPVAVDTDPAELARAIDALAAELTGGRP